MVAFLSTCQTTVRSRGWKVAKPLFAYSTFVKHIRSRRGFLHCRSCPHPTFIWYPRHGLLEQRAGHAAKMYRENLPPEGVSLTECSPDAAGFIAGE